MKEILEIHKDDRLNAKPGITRLYADEIQLIQKSMGRIFGAYDEHNAASGLKYYCDIPTKELNKVVIRIKESSGRHSLKPCSSISFESLKSFLCRVYMGDKKICEFQFVLKDKSLEDANEEVRLQLKKLYTKEEYANCRPVVWEIE